MVLYKSSMNNKVIIASEYLHYFVLLTMLSLIPLLLAKEDSNGSLLSAASIIANLTVMFLLPIIIKWSKFIPNYRNLLMLRLLTMVSLSALLASQSWWALCSVQAIALLTLSLQQVNTNRSFKGAGLSLSEKSVFMFEIGTATVGFIVALSMYLITDMQHVTSEPLIAFSISCLFINFLLLMGVKKEEVSCEIALSNQVQDKGSIKIPFSIKLFFCRSQLCFLAQRLLWFIAPIWFAQTDNVGGFINWLLISSCGVLLAIFIVRLKEIFQFSIEHLFVFSNFILVISISAIVIVPSDKSIYLSGVVCTFAIPIQRTYSRQFADILQSEFHSAAELIAHGNRLIRFIHMSLVCLFPIAMQFGGLQVTTVLSLVAISFLAMSNKILPIQNQTLIRS